MQRSITLLYFIFSTTQAKKELSLSFKREGFLGMLKICMPIFREKKSGTSVKVKLFQSYSTPIPPPPIRPLVEKHPLFETTAMKIKVQKSLKECA